MFQVGDKVVYPMHGAGVIESIEEKEILGEKQHYYILRLSLGEMKVMIPLNNVDQIGIRQVISIDEVNRVVQTLGERAISTPGNWNKRYRNNMDKMKSGNVLEVADVVRNLSLREKEKGLSTVERKMLSNARQILISELILTNYDNEEAVINLVDTLAGKEESY